MILPKTTAVGLLCLAATACAAVQPADSPRVLRAQPSFAASPLAASAPVTSVAPVLARGAAGERRYTYVDRAAPAEVRQAATLFWEESPSRIVERALVDGLRAELGPTFGSDTVANAERRVIARLERFEEATGGGGPVEASIALDVTVIGTAERTVRLTNRYCATAPIAGAEPSERAQAFETALKTVVSALARDIRAGSAGSPGC